MNVIENIKPYAYSIIYQFQYVYSMLKSRVFILKVVQRIQDLYDKKCMYFNPNGLHTTTIESNTLINARFKSTKNKSILVKYMQIPSHKVPEVKDLRSLQ
jgi:hypothetical protein